MEPNKTDVQIKVSEESFKGTFSNAAIISHTQSEFLLDFISVFHGKGVLGSRVVVTPAHAKELLRILGENVALYEGRFGEIKDVEPAKFDASAIN